MEEEEARKLLDQIGWGNETSRSWQGFDWRAIDRAAWPLIGPGRFGDLKGREILIVRIGWSLEGASRVDRVLCQLRFAGWGPDWEPSLSLLLPSGGGRAASVETICVPGIAVDSFEELVSGTQARALGLLARPQYTRLSLSITVLGGSERSEERSRPDTLASFPTQPKMAVRSQTHPQVMIPHAALSDRGTSIPAGTSPNAPLARPLARFGEQERSAAQNMAPGSVHLGERPGPTLEWDSDEGMTPVRAPTQESIRSISSGSKGSTLEQLAALVEAGSSVQPGEVGPGDEGLTLNRPGAHGAAAAPAAAWSEESFPLPQGFWDHGEESSPKQTASELQRLLVLVDGPAAGPAASLTRSLPQEVVEEDELGLPGDSAQVIDELEEWLGREGEKE